MKVVEKKARDKMIAPPAEAATDVEVVAKAERRRFTAQYKRRIVREADRCTKPWRGRSVASARGAVFLVADDVASGSRPGRARGAVAEEVRTEG
jgi:hypothetical protein